MRKPTILAKNILRNTESTTLRVDTALTYEFKYSSYWGQGKAILKGLKTTIRNTSGSIPTEIEWGLEENEDRNIVYK